MTTIASAGTSIAEPAEDSGHPLAQEVAAALAEHFSGPYYVTPDGLQAPLIDSLGSVVRLENVVREDIAVGLAAGARLAGGEPVLLMQNSGFGQSVNALASLVLPYELPMLLVIGMRGTDADDTAENLVMGRITEDLLRMFGITARALPARDPGPIVSMAAADLRAGRSSALLISPGLFGWKAKA